MTQPSIADYQVDLTDSLKGKIDLNDLKDVNAPNPVDGEALVWNNTAGKWEPAVVAVASSFYMEITGAGVGTVMPGGWSVVRDSAGVYTITHNLGNSTLGYAILQADAVAVALSGNIIATTTNTFTIEFGGGVDTDFAGRVIT